MRVFLVFLLFVGILLVVLNERLHDNPPLVMYRYIPRDLDTYLRDTEEAQIAFDPQRSDAWFDRYYH